MSDVKKRQNQVEPGPCPIDPETGLPICPPPTEIDIIKTRKVFNECIHTQVETVLITPVEGAWDDTTEALEAICQSVELVGDPVCTVLNGDLVQVSFSLEVSAGVPLDTNGIAVQSTVIDVEKNLIIERAGEEGLDVQCHVFPECLFCFISGRDEETNAVTEVTCCVGIMVLLKVDAEVQLLIPTYGYPPQPPECEQVLGECPEDFEPVWPPYPPQIFWTFT